MIASIVSKAIGFSAKAFFDYLVSWILEGTQWFLDELGQIINASSQLDLSSPYFMAEFKTMELIGLAIIFPLFLVAVIKTALNQSAGLRQILIQTPLSLVGSNLALFVLSTLVTVVDSFCASVQKTCGINVAALFHKVSLKLAVVALQIAPGFAMGIACIVLLFGAVLLWIELIFRSSAIELAAVFIPLAMSGLVLPSTSHWARRLGEILFALVISKLVIVTAICLGAQALLSGLATFSINDVIIGAAIELVAVLAPAALLKIIPLTEGYLIGGALEASAIVKSKVSNAARSAANVAIESFGSAGDLPMGNSVNADSIRNSILFRSESNNDALIVDDNDIEDTLNLLKERKASASNYKSKRFFTVEEKSSGGAIT